MSEDKTYDDDDLMDKICDAIGFDAIIKLVRDAYQSGKIDGRAEVLAKVEGLFRDVPSKLLEPPRPAERSETGQTAQAPPARQESKPAPKPPEPEKRATVAPVARETPTSKPAAVPTNAEMAQAAIRAAGHSLTGPEILKFVREKYWFGFPSTWPGALANIVASGNLSKGSDGRYGLPASPKIVFEPKPDVAPARPSPMVADQKAAAFAAAVAPIQSNDSLRMFEHKGVEVALPVKEWRVVSALGVIIGEGFLDYQRLAKAAFKSERHPPSARDYLANMATAVNPKLKACGLELKEIQKMGFCLRELT